MDEFERKHEHLALLREHAKNDGDTRGSTDNSIIADNEAAFELGHFSDDPKRKEPDLFGFAVRARRDAFVARLNSADILDRMERDQTLALELAETTAKTLRVIYWLVAVNFGLSLGILGVVHPGWWRIW